MNTHIGNSNDNNNQNNNRTMNGFASIQFGHSNGSEVGGSEVKGGKGK